MKEFDIQYSVDHSQNYHHAPHPEVRIRKPSPSPILFIIPMMENSQQWLNEQDSNNDDSKDLMCFSERIVQGIHNTKGNREDQSDYTYQGSEDLKQPM